MAGYKPLRIAGNSTGLVQEREEFLLPDDAYPILQNAYVWRERIKRKKGYELLGRLQRTRTISLNISKGSSGNINITLSLSGDALGTVAPKTLAFIVGAPTNQTITDVTGDGNLTIGGAGVITAATINYITHVLTITVSAVLALSNLSGPFDYYPNLPVMGIRIRELQNSASDQTIFFDQKYAYKFNNPQNKFVEFIPGTTWNASGASVAGTDFFFSTNYWQSDPAFTTFGTTNVKLFWVTNNTGFNGATADPPRITDGTTWMDFFPSAWSQIDATEFLTNWLCMLPYRGRMVVFNTWEGPDAANSLQHSNRIRWSTIGNPFIPYGAGPPAKGSWRDDIRGQGGFLDIPTSEDIVSVGFVRDNLVIYCERSTWQLRYTGRSIAPFNIERVNSELGCESTFSAVQFDTSLMGIGDKGIVECDSYKSQRVDIKIPDYVFKFNALNNGVARVQGIRDFPNRLAYWTVPFDNAYAAENSSDTWIFPNQRLVYNYENDSWAIFTDSLTALGYYQTQSGRTWLNTPIPWKKCFFNWIDQPAEYPSIVGGNQQGFVEYLDELTTNDVSLYISAITANTTTPTVITSPNHNMQTGFVIEISQIPIGTPFASSLNSPKNGLITAVTLVGTSPVQITSNGNTLQTGDSIEINNVTGTVELNGNDYTITTVDANNFTLNGTDSSLFTPYISGGDWLSLSENVFAIVVTGADTFELWKYDPVTLQFSDPQLDVPGSTYIGGGLIAIRDNFSIRSKKFNFLDEGQNIQLGYLDILMDVSENDQDGAISLNVYLDYDDSETSNTLPNNDINDGAILGNPDTFFNSVIPLAKSNLSNIRGSKFWQRVYCPTRANFLTLEYTFSNAQMAGEEQNRNVQIDAQVLWLRKAGRMTQG